MFDEYSAHISISETTIVKYLAGNGFNTSMFERVIPGQVIT